MTTLTHTHTPHAGAISTVHEMYSSTQYTFCKDCEQNIERFWIEEDDRLSFWSSWMVSN